jgi:hypothetical protein
MKLISDIDATQTKRIFEVLKEESPTNLFEGYTSIEIETLSLLFKMLAFRK